MTTPTVPASLPTTASARPNPACRITSDNTRIAAAVRMPAQDAAFVVAISASVAAIRILCARVAWLGYTPGIIVHASDYFEEDGATMAALLVDTVASDRWS